MYKINPNRLTGYFGKINFLGRSDFQIFLGIYRKKVALSSLAEVVHETPIAICVALACNRKLLFSMDKRSICIENDCFLYMKGQHV